MAEQAWLNEQSNPQGMVWELRGTSATRTKNGRRKLRLFGCGCCRLFWEHITNEQFRQAIETAERFAEGKVTKQELETTRLALQPLPPSVALTPESKPTQEGTAWSMIHGLTRPQALEPALYMTCYQLPLAGYCGDKATANRIICDLLRDIFGNPFRPVTFSPSWRTDTAVSLARGMYEARDFGAMPILADALQDAGCDSADILNHCRDPKQVHVRGCWVVDLVLGKG